MATRKPLVRVAGKSQQLPAADTIDVPGARFTESETEPTVKDYGDRWLDETSGIKYTWISPGVWVDLATAGIDFDDLVQTTGDQSIAGAKTFTGQVGLPSWTTAGRPATPTTNSIGRNTDLGCVEYWDGTHWVPEGWRSASLSLAGTGVEFTGIDSTAREILVAIQNGGTAAAVYVQIGPSAGVATTGYVSTSVRSLAAGNAVTTSTTDFRFANASGNANGIFRLSVLPSTNIWVAAGDLARQGEGVSTIGGYISLVGPLTRLALSPASGSWGSGTAAIFWRI